MPIFRFYDTRMVKISALLLGIFLVLGLSGVVRFSSFTLANPDLRYRGSSNGLGYYLDGQYEREDRIFTAEYDTNIPDNGKMSRFIPVSFEYVLKTQIDEVEVYNRDGVVQGNLSDGYQVMVFMIHRSDGELMANHTVIGDTYLVEGTFSWKPHTDQFLNGEPTTFYFQVHVYSQYHYDGELQFDLSSSNGLTWIGKGNFATPVVTDTGNPTGTEVIFTNKVHHHPLFLVTIILLLAIYPGAYLNDRKDEL